MSHKISVIMGVYNCEQTLTDAIESILRQTYDDWELIICDDGSDDRSYKIAERFQKEYPDKIVLLKNKTNSGLGFTLNHCLTVATGEYIARMDADDLCVNNRLEKQLKVMEQEPEISIVSSDMSYFDENGTWGIISHPLYPQPNDFVHGKPFCHAPCLVKREAYDKVNGYSVSKWLMRVEDYYLWVKMYEEGFKGKNMHETLYMMRDDCNAYKRRRFKYRLNESYVIASAIRKFKLPIYNYIYVMRPIIVGLLPFTIYNLFHKRKLNESKLRSK